MLGGVGIPELWECSVRSWPGDFGVSAWGFGMFSGMGAWSFGSIEDWCLHFWDVQWDQCLELWEYLGRVPASHLGMQTQGLGMFDGVGTPCFRAGLWGRCPGFWECLAPWTLGMPNSAWGFKDVPWGRCPGISGCLREFGLHL